MVPKLEIPKDENVDEQVHKLVTGVHNAHTKLAKVQLELNLQITEFQLKALHSTPQKVKGKWKLCWSVMHRSTAHADPSRWPPIVVAATTQIVVVPP